VNTKRYFLQIPLNRFANPYQSSSKGIFTKISFSINRNKMKKSHFLLVFLLFIGLNAKAQTTITLQDVDKYQVIGKKTSVFQDAHFLTIDKVLQPEIQAQFKPYTQDVPHFGPLSDAVWFRFDVIKEVEQDFYLQVGSAFADSIALYAVTDGKVTETQVGGDNYPFDERSVKVTTFLFPLNIPKGEKQTYFLRTKTMQPAWFPLRTGTLKAFMEDTHLLDFLQGIYAGFMLLMILYNLFIYFSTKEKIYLYYVAYVVSITWFMFTIYQYIFEFIWPNMPIFNEYGVASSGLTMLTATLFTRHFLQTEKRSPKLHKVSHLFMGLGVLVIILVFTPFQIPALMLAQIGILLMAFYFLILAISLLRKGYQPAKFYLAAWISLIIGFIAAMLDSVNVLPNMYYINDMQIGSAIEVTLLSFALADRINIYKKEREDARELALALANEKADIIQKQNIILEEKVAARTDELQKSLTDLKATQAQLIQKEKLASLGELTAGVAHEIQNPLNFVNNFSELSVDLAKELNEEIERDTIDTTYIKEIVGDLTKNQEKIHHHGKRASNIVKGMLEHARTSTGERQLTDINALCDESLRLAFHGMRAKDKSFNADFKTDFDPNLPKAQIVPQDIGRVLLNLMNNAFYAVHQRKQQLCESSKLSQSLDAQYTPSVSLTTQSLDNQIIIKVKDNGGGIPKDILAKIFQPFFTTKPTGEGTGLGLSLSYDIVTKGHGGTLEVESTEGVGTAFIIKLLV
jgi:hypothetical protein